MDLSGVPPTGDVPTSGNHSPSIEMNGENKKTKELAHGFFCQDPGCHLQAHNKMLMGRMSKSSQPPAACSLTSAISLCKELQGIFHQKKNVFDESNFSALTLMLEKFKEGDQVSCEELYQLYKHCSGDSELMKRLGPINESNYLIHEKIGQIGGCIQGLLKDELLSNVISQLKPIVEKEDAEGGWDDVSDEEDPALYDPLVDRVKKSNKHLIRIRGMTINGKWVKQQVTLLPPR